MDGSLPHIDRDRIEVARRRAARLLGMRSADIDRKAALEREVALAKGRAALKGTIDQFLEELQTAAHRRNTGSFEKLLSLLVQEVVPGSAPIGLELSTERGLPALDIFSREADDVREDVFADQGGAVTNVVCTGLRLIAAVKCGGRRFLVLDESDCWIKPDRIPDFYRIFRQAAERVGIQCLVISHHSHSLLGAGIAVAELQGSKADGACIINHGDVSALWGPDTPGFRSLRLTEFQNHPLSELHLSPGITALIGPNNLGKSSIVRALAAVFYGDARDSLIRRGAKECMVELEMEQGRRLCFSRKLRRNPVNLWSMRTADGSILEEDNVRFETGGRSVPDWVSAKTGIATVDGLEIHIANQKQPVFLLSDPPARRASVLSIGQESSHLREMITIQRERAMKDQATIRDGEREIAELSGRIAALEDVEAIESAADDCARLLDEAAAAARTAERIDDVLSRIETAAAARERCRERLGALDALPADDALRILAEKTQEAAGTVAFVDGLAAAVARAAALRERVAALATIPDPPELAPADACHQLAETISAAHARVAALNARTAVLTALPGTAPILIDNEQLIETGRKIGSCAAQIAKNRAQLTEIENQSQELTEQTNALLTEIGHSCPTCGQTVTDAAQLLREPH